MDGYVRYVCYVALHREGSYVMYVMLHYTGKEVMLCTLCCTAQGRTLCYVHYVALHREGSYPGVTTTGPISLTRQQILNAMYE